MITLLTCTGDRPELFRRLERWMLRQSLRWTDWIVVDDGYEPTACTLGQRYVRLPAGRSPADSFATNMEAAFREHERLRNSDFVFVIEDDDWYGPNYLASLAVGLMEHDLAGERRLPMYHVAGRAYRTCGNRNYATLCATAFRAAVIPQILPLIDRGDTSLDCRIWYRVRGSKLLRRTGHCVGLKGQDGRRGLSNGHSPAGFHPDPEGAMLAKWIGGDASEVLQPGAAALVHGHRPATAGARYAREGAIEAVRPCAYRT